jgi:hypothetical protein
MAHSLCLSLCSKTLNTGLVNFVTKSLLLFLSLSSATPFFPPFSPPRNSTPCIHATYLLLRRAASPKPTLESRHKGYLSFKKYIIVLSNFSPRLAPDSRACCTALQQHGAGRLRYAAAAPSSRAVVARASGAGARSAMSRPRGEAQLHFETRNFCLPPPHHKMVCLILPACGGQLGPAAKEERDGGWGGARAAGRPGGGQGPGATDCFAVL